MFFFLFISSFNSTDAMFLLSSFIPSVLFLFLPIFAFYIFAEYLFSPIYVSFIFTQQFFSASFFFFQSSADLLLFCTASFGFLPFNFVVFFQCFFCLYPYFIRYIPTTEVLFLLFLAPLFFVLFLFLSIFAFFTFIFYLATVFHHPNYLLIFFFR
jgi:hypothetical protein